MGDIFWDTDDLLGKGAWCFHVAMDGYPMFHHPFRTMGFSHGNFKHLIWGTPHDYGNHHMNIELIWVQDWCSHVVQLTIEFKFMLEHGIKAFTFPMHVCFWRSRSKDIKLALKSAISNDILNHSKWTIIFSLLYIRWNESFPQRS